MAIPFLADLPLFAGLSPEDLERLCAMAETVNIKAGDILIEEGSPGDALYIALSGNFEVSKRSGDRDVPIASSGPGDIIGEMSLLEQSARTASVRALEDSSLLKISRAAFEQLLLRSPQAALAVLHTVMGRLRNTELMLRQSEKMAALGTLSAGLAHELNNPAAAVRRSAGQLRDVVAHWQKTAARVSAAELSPQQVERINGLREELPLRSARPIQLTTLERNDLETAVQEYLEDGGAEDSWDLAPALVGLGFDVAELDRITEGLNPEQKVGILEWIGTGSTAYALLDEVKQGAERIAEIVKAVKQYSYLDQAPVQLVDVHEGLDNTLIIMKHKLKQGVSVHKDYDSTLPRIEAYASELNQVWTNLIDNAVDAMGGQGDLTIRTRKVDDRVQVQITDSGPGIPANVQSRIFEAFFTTKEPGVGTGLGLHISYNIITQKHSGDIRVESRPGETTFTVTLPLELPARKA
jgi:signal transduction histidine kinase